jgi:galactose mutarotase-like enzyme
MNYKISIKQEQYSTYILADESAQSFLEVVPQRGAIITNWRIQGQNILYLDKERFADPSLSVRGGIPILFPICGNLPESVYTVGDRQYNLKQHGFARDLPWQVSATNTDHQCAKIDLTLTSNAQTMSVYPFEFELAFSYQLQGNSLKIHQTFTNNSDRPMPFSTGLHPYFWVKDKVPLEFQIPANLYQDQISKEVKSFAGKFDFDREELDLAFGDLKGHSTSITDKQRRLKIQLNYSDLYSTLVFWTIKGKEYVCLEPWSAPRNSLNTGEQLTYLEPKTSCNALVEMVVSYL